MRIPVIMCHGISDQGDYPLSEEHFNALVQIAAKRVKERYRFGRLWLIGSMVQVDGGEMRVAELLGAQGDDEADGGPPMAARYIERGTSAYLLPSIEIQSPLLHTKEAFHCLCHGVVARSFGLCAQVPRTSPDAF